MATESLPAYLRLPDGVRLSGSASVDEQGTLCFIPKQALSPVPPSGLPVDVLVAGLPDDDGGQVRVLGSIDESGPKRITLEADEALPETLLRQLAPDLGPARTPESRSTAAGNPNDPSDEAASDPAEVVQEMIQDGIERMGKSMRRFLVDLGDHLFDLATSARYGSAGRHRHYDALNQLKRSSMEVIQTFQEELRTTLNKLEKDNEEAEFADFEGTSARALGLVGMDEIDQQVASDKIVNAILDSHRVALECLTIRNALLKGIDPPKASTPFHPAYVLKSFLSSLHNVTDDADVTEDIIRFFGQRFTQELDKLYPALNGSLIAAGIEPDLEEEVMEAGSLLNPPPEKRVLKSESRDKPEEKEVPTPDNRSGGAHGAAGAPAPGPTSGDTAGAPSGAGTSQAGSGGTGTRANDMQGSAGHAAVGTTGGDDRAEGADPASVDSDDTTAPRQKHDAIYDAVLAALDSQQERSEEALAAEATEEHADPIQGSDDVDDAAARNVHMLDQGQILSSLRSLKDAEPEHGSLAALPPLTSLLSASQGENGARVQLDRDSVNRLNFIDTVFRTLQTNFEVSEDMAPSLAQLRVPLARLSLQEPRFFTQPEHPAHQLLDKLSTLASSDHTISRSLQKKVEDIVSRVSTEYDEDSAVFEKAQAELDTLVGQKKQLMDKSVSRVVSTLTGKQKLVEAQQFVEDVIQEHVDTQATPAPLQQLLDSGWRAALVQLALREGEDSIAWREEVSLLQQVLTDMERAEAGDLPERELREMQLRLRALNKRLGEFNPGSIDHELALKDMNALLRGERAADSQPYHAPKGIALVPPPERIEQLPRLRRWLKRAMDLQPGARLRYRDKEGHRRQMRLVWVSPDRNRFAFVNERGQKIADFTAIQLARQLSRGATPPSSIDKMSVLDQSMFNTLEEAQRTLSFDRNRDQVTRLINAESLTHQLRRSLRHAQARGTEHAFMLLNIDNFSLVNEVFDTPSGDEVLAEFARLLGQLNDRRALTARMEDDEFGILLTYRSAEEAREVAEKIRTDIAAGSLQVLGESVSFTVSMGVAPILQTSESADDVLQNARYALETAKGQGRDQVVVYSPDQEEIVEYNRKREASRRRLEEAMSTDQLVLRAQPIVQTAVDGSETARHHYEVLLALQDDEGNLGSPQEFITSAERFGFIAMVDRWVLRETFTWMSSLVDKQKVVPELSINLSGTSITDDTFLEYILEQISEWGVGTSRICFEITETGAIDNLPRAADFVRTLKNIGCKFSLDDFGTGLASHNYLRELPVDYVKIDGTFITNIHGDSTDYAMAKSINDLAHFLGQKTVAECVESLDSLPALREIGIDFLQGWGIGMPMILQEISDELPSLET